ncbi:MAG: hypothetical protein WCX75_05230 [Fibrobacteraceae bacterium]
MNFLIQCATFFVTNLMAKNLGALNFGYLGVLQNDYLIFCALADFGTATLILAFFGRRATHGQLLVQIFQLRFFLSITSMLLMCLFAFTIRWHHPAFRGELILSLGLIFQHAFFDWYFICGKFWKRFLISKILHTISYSTMMGIALLYLKLDKIESIAFVMIFAAIPTWGFGVFSAFNKRILIFTHRTFYFIKLMLNKAFPFALASLTSFAYLPIGLYAADLLAPPEFLAAFNFSYKLIMLISGFMISFLSSSLVLQHETRDFHIHLHDILTFIFFITVLSCPLLIVPQFVLKIIFFAAPWTTSLLETSSFCLRLLSLSLILQAIRLPIISTMLKEKQIWKYVSVVSIGGVVNIAMTFGIVTLTGQFNLIPLLTLSGDLVSTSLFGIFFLNKKRFVW